MQQPERPEEAIPQGEPVARAEQAGPLAHLLSRGAGASPLERRLLLEGVEARDTETAELRRELRSLRELLDVAREISSILDQDTLLEAILDSAIRLTNAERGFLLLMEGERFDVILARGHRQDSLDPAVHRISETLARQCLNENRVIPHDNISGFPELRDVRSIKALDLYAAVSVPLRERGRNKGVLYLDSSVPGLKTSPAELNVLEAFASHVSISLLNARLMRDLEDSRLLLTRENEDLRAEARSSSGFGQILGRGPAMLKVFDKIRLLKDAEIPVLLLGESGTGKELVARALHYEGLRRSGPFVPVNCAGFPSELLDSLLFGYRRGAFTGAVQDRPGLVEQADGGTIFLDEIGDMPLVLQVKLLRFLESGEFRRIGENETRGAHARVISATNRDLAAMVRGKTFREDLYFRLAGVRLEIPPLRERREDLPLLLDHFLAQARARLPRGVSGITHRARRFVNTYLWPGNVRQLRYAIEGACALVPEGQPVDEEHLRMQLPLDEVERGLEDCRSLHESKARLEQELLTSVLNRYHWNITRAAKELGISRQHLHNRIRAHDLKRPSSGS